MAIYIYLFIYIYIINQYINSQILIFCDEIFLVDGESHNGSHPHPLSIVVPQERAVVHEVARQVGLHSSEKEGRGSNVTGDFMVTKNGQ